MRFLVPTTVNVGVQDLDADLPRNRRQALEPLQLLQACRMKVYYSRKIQARNLRRQELSVRQIADRLTADEHAVRPLD